MAPAILNKTNKSIGHFAKQFDSVPKWQGSKPISVLKKIIYITTDKESIQNTEAILKNVNQFIAVLPANDKDIKGSTLKKYLDHTNHNILVVHNILTDINKTIGNDDNITIDDDNIKLFISNFKEIKSQLEFVSNYLYLALEVHNSKKEYKKGEYTNYTLDELLEKMNAA